MVGGTQRKKYYLIMLPGNVFHNKVMREKKHQETRMTKQDKEFMVTQIIIIM